MVIASVFYIVKIIVTSLVYSNIMDIEKHGFMKVINKDYVPPLGGDLNYKKALHY